MDMLKSFFTMILTFLSALSLEACTVNPATGEQQFAALMSPQQEVTIGESQHKKIEKEQGFVKDAALVNYVAAVGQRVSRDTERPDVVYKFFVIDSPNFNAFALPGGYVYVTRGLLALANNEAELASVLGHEVGHITARHSAERFSKSAVTSLGLDLLSIALGSASASEALGVGANLYLSSYSRSQEYEADALGARYMARNGYHPQAVPDFLLSLQRKSELEARMQGQKKSVLAGYFASHPATPERVEQAKLEITKYDQSGDFNRAEYLRVINGMVYGDSAEHGFVRGRSFIHPVLNFAFEVPEGFLIQNLPAKIVASNSNGTVMIFDMDKRKEMDVVRYLEGWVEDAQIRDMSATSINGMSAATGSIEGQINSRPVDIRLVAIAMGNHYMRFQFVIPKSASMGLIDELRRTTYSFRTLGPEDKAKAKPMRIKTFVAARGDSVASVSARLPFSNYKEEQFRALNGLASNQSLELGQTYKTVE